MAAVFSVAVAVNLEFPATMATLQPIDGFPLYKFQMAVPPLLTAVRGAKPPLFASWALLDWLAAAFA